MENQRTIKVSDFVYAVRKYRNPLVLLVAAAFFCGVGLMFLSRYRADAKKLSKITASFAVTAENSQGGYSANRTEPQSQDIYLAENLADAVMYVCTSDALAATVRSNLGLPDAIVQEVRSNLSIRQYKKTQIIELSLCWPDPEEGISILTAFMDAVPDILVRVLGLGSISVVNEPKAAPVERQWHLEYPAVGVIFAVAAGFVFILSRLCVHPTLVNPSGASRLFGLETLAEVPLDSMVTERLYQNSINGAAYRLINAFHRMQAVLLITSAMPDEGKTKITASLGARLANLGKRVLLIDLNMENPSLSKEFSHQAEYRHSLNAAYRGEIPLQEAVCSVTSNLDFIPSLPENGALLIDEHLREMIGALKRNYDYVLLDTASVGQNADTLQIGQMADSAVFVIRHDLVWVDVIQSCIGILRSSGVDIVGSIVNGISEYGSGFNLYCRRAGITDQRRGGGKQ